MGPSRTVKSDTLKAEIIIIGAGGAGLAAAVAAAEKGAKNIVILEAGNKAGGNAIYAPAVGYGMARPTDKKHPDPQAQRDEQFLNTMQFTHWRTNARVVSALLDKGEDTKQWLEKMGVEFPAGFAGMKPGGPKAGAKIVQALLKKSEAMGGRVLYQTRAERLITNQAGKVVGVLATAKGKELEITAKSVIIATGGIYSNKKLMKKYFPHYESGVDMYIGGEPRNGDGLLMATKVGAATEPMVAPEYSANRTPWSAVLFLITKHPKSLLVNKKGRRFANESLSQEAYNAQFRQPGMTSYVLIDESIKKALYKEEISPIDKYVLAANITLDVIDEKIRETLRKEGLYATYETWPEVADKDLRWQASKGRAKIANSWDEIAKWMGADPAVLKATIDEYNAACKKGHDDVFAKDKKYLSPLRTPPYYAIRCSAVVTVVHGGIKVSENMEVIDGQGDPIPGLYAVGCDAGLSYTDTYGGDAMGWVINSGRVAGESAAKHASGKN
jgi:fumarate reductase flavoprotein subunit